jgi:hypothetical protein
LDNTTGDRIAPWRNSSEDDGGDTARSKTKPTLFEDIDTATDQFVTLLIDHPTSATDRWRSSVFLLS